LSLALIASPTSGTPKLRPELVRTQPRVGSSGMGPYDRVAINTLSNNADGRPPPFATVRGLREHDPGDRR